uniref:Glycosyltransferase family 92 protein n=1 Tax=Plectus sambesii TaxID=2011161 RepID=A0A914V061_9BILA
MRLARRLVVWTRHARRCVRSHRSLFLINGFLFLLLLIAQFDDGQLDDDADVNYAPIPADGVDLLDDVDYALETFQYIRDMQVGRALVQSVVEPKRTVRSFDCAAWSAWRRPTRAPRVEPDVEWQTLSDTQLNMQLFIYSAYMDRRNNSLYPDVNSVQLLVMARRTANQTIFCQFYDDDSLHPAAIVRAHAREIWQRGWDPRNRFYIPALITCPIPAQLASAAPPAFVSLTSKPCNQPANLLPVQGRQPTAVQDKVVVCVKGMDFLKDVSIELVEWLELQYLLGADRVVFYTYYVHPQTAKVLDFYERERKLVQVSLTLPGESPNQPFIRSNFIWRNRQQKRRNELMPYNDCLYRHIGTHRYVLIADIDEAIVPLKYGDWPTMLDNIRRQYEYADDFTAISTINVFKFPNLTTEIDESIPKYMYMLRHRRRSAALSKRGDYGKSFMYSPNVATVFNHFALHRLRPRLRNTVYVDPGVALKLHYKDSCPIESRDECPDLLHRTVDDPSLDRFAPNLTQRVTAVLKTLNMI